MMNEPVASIMTTPVISVGPDDMVDKVYQMMIEKRIHHVPVVEGNLLVGIITTFDLLKNGIPRSEYANTQCKSLMIKKVATLEENAKIGTAAEVFLEHRFHALPVVNEAHEILGIVTTHDILKYEFRKEYPHNPW